MSGTSVSGTPSSRCPLGTDPALNGEDLGSRCQAQWKEAGQKHERWDNYFEIEMSEVLLQPKIFFQYVIFFFGSRHWLFPPMRTMCDACDVCCVCVLCCGGACVVCVCSVSSVYGVCVLCVHVEFVACAVQACALRLRVARVLCYVLCGGSVCVTCALCVVCLGT